MKRLLVLLIAAVFTVLTIGAANATPAPPRYNPPMATGPLPKVWQTPPPPPPTDQPAPPSNAANRSGPGVNAAVRSTLPNDAKLSPVRPDGTKASTGSVSPDKAGINRSGTVAAASAGGCGSSLGPWNALYFQACDWPSINPGLLFYQAWLWNSAYTFRTYYYQTTTIRDGRYYNGPVRGLYNAEPRTQYTLEEGETRCDNANFTQVAVRIYSGYNYWSPWAYGPTISRATTSC